MYATRKAITDRITAGLELSGLRLRRTTERSIPPPVTEEEIARVRQVLGEEASKARIVPFVISTERRADDGHVIKAAGWQLDRYSKNPVVLWQHNSYSRARIGDSVVTVEGDRLTALCAYFPREVDPFSHALGEIAATRGQAASVGWDTLAATPAPQDVLKHNPWALDIHSAALIEWSNVNIGADEDALAGRAAGIDVTPIADEASRRLDELTVVVRAQSEKLSIELERLERLYKAAADPARPRFFDQGSKADMSIKLTGTLTSLLP